MNQSTEQDHFKRNFIILCVILVGASIIFFVLKQIYWTIPIEQKVQQEADQYTAESKQVELMTCEQLHDGLLHNTIQWSDNIQRALERYVAGCEGQK